ncbi:energy transducer TonB [Mitsuaria sp. PDC51]|uniref:energy transducer TonB n=1 Tax=Mitsuaria sp. PDC51 TaxID=1881035 RepID=UPI000B8826D0|nr:energy transducer TonB [Mitsuaria sp. PDC51]
MTAPALRLHGLAPRWSGWAMTAAVHAAMLLALASAFAPQRSAPVSMAPTGISARLLPFTTTSAAAAMAPSATTMSPIALPRSALDAAPVPDLPPPLVEIAATPPLSPPASSHLDTPVASGVTNTGASSATSTATAPAAGATVAVDTNAMPARQAAAATTTTAVAPLPAVVQPPSPTATDLPATLPADHRLCSERQTARHYPALLRDRGIQGLVRLRVKVDPEGRAAEVVIAGGSGWRLLDEAARRVAESCPYTPARRGDQRLASWIEYPVRFALQAAPLQ